jgi:dTDP-4-amino-4,6-dideoxygalactose transaminase
MGYNWRLPEVASLMGIRQLSSLNEFVKRRQELAKIYDGAFADHPDINIVEPPDKKGHNYFKYTITLKNHDRPAVHKALEANDIQPSGYIYELPLHKQPIFPEENRLSLPKTEFVCAHHLCLPIFYGMTDEQSRYVASTLKKILAEKEPKK